MQAWGCDNGTLERGWGTIGKGNIDASARCQDSSTGGKNSFENVWRFSSRYRSQIFSTPVLNSFYSEFAKKV